MPESNQQPLTIDAAELAEWQEADSLEASSTTSATQVSTDEKYARSQLRVIRENKDWQLQYIKLSLDPASPLINIHPEYQRRDRWDISKRSRLIESLLMNIPIPPIFLYETDYNEYEVVDGRQRLETVRRFLADEFELRKMEFWPELNGKKYSELPSVLQKGLLRRSLSVVILLAETHQIPTNEVDIRRILFDRLNTGGIALTQQEVRNAIYPGEFNSMLHRVADGRLFREIWGIPLPPQEDGNESINQAYQTQLAKNVLYSKMGDIEIVLRFFALRDAILHHKTGSLRQILDRYMHDNANTSPNENEKLEQQFNATLTELHGLFGSQTFRLPSGKISRPLYDALMIAESIGLEKPENRDPSMITSSLNTALEDEDKYDLLVGRGNTIESVHKRVALASEILGVSLS